MTDGYDDELPSVVAPPVVVVLVELISRGVGVFVW